MYNNSYLGKLTDAIVNTVYFETDFSGGLIPPPQSYFLLDNSGENLLDNSNEPLLV